MDSGVLLFLVSCTEIVPYEVRNRFRAALVVHASDLPKGRGWSPHIWELLNGADHITLSLLEAEDKVDSGRIWKKLVIPIPRDTLWHEINQRLFDAEIDLLEFAIQNYQSIEPYSQASDIDATYYPRRKPSDSMLNPEKSIAELFDLVRVADPNRYPAYFDFRGSRYVLKFERYKNE